jgi:hypothetical protein
MPKVTVDRIKQIIGEELNRAQKINEFNDPQKMKRNNFSKRKRIDHAGISGITGATDGLTKAIDAFLEKAEKYPKLLDALELKLEDLMTHLDDMAENPKAYLTEPEREKVKKTFVMQLKDK